MGISRCVLFIICVALLQAAPVHAGMAFLDPIYGVSTTSNITYASGNTDSGPIPLRLDIYRPTNIGLGALPALSPAVVVQHGGAWTSGSKEQAQTPATFLAKHGFTVIA